VTDTERRFKEENRLNSVIEMLTQENERLKKEIDSKDS
jgi:hypothetical protein|tara:strand:+ start:77 stop:190 length:114 start_codon:yes stop_codon:yes gene_type:complete